MRKRALDVVRDGVCEWSDARACKITGLNARTVRLTTGEILRRPPESNIEAERIQAVAEFVKSEREWVAIFKVAVELAGLSKVGTWPKGDSNEYIVAIESAALMGLIERAGSNVRRKREVVETKAVQGSLFE